MRSYVSTARKHQVNPLHALRQLFQGDPWLPAPPRPEPDTLRTGMTAMVLFLIETEVNDVSVYSSSESLTGDLEVYDVDAGVFQVYDAQARYLPLTWQAPDPRSREAGQACLGPPQQGQEDRLYDALRRFLPLIGRADLADAPVLDLQAAAQAISDYHRGPSSRPRWRWPWQRGASPPATGDPE